MLLYTRIKIFEKKKPFSNTYCDINLLLNMKKHRKQANHSCRRLLLVKPSAKNNSQSEVMRYRRFVVNRAHSQ